ncbi:MAG: ABC transporter ATP-binding protein, partial [Elusimicrobia bacterium]|nr:ABC transporter ATP-binding protein [Elusimicrobiota bacterium]
FYAVKNNTFKIKKGEIFGLLGPNGAGKSTSFKMMCGLSKPTSGTTKIFGTDMKENPTKARSYLGYMAQKFSLYGNLTVEQNLNFFAGVYGLNKKDKQQRIDEMIKSFNFETVLKQKADELPLGFKQRLSMACAVMHNPPVLFLDEPTSGVDVVARRDFWNHITSLAKKGVTVLITTHFMDEAEFCDRISLFYRGQTIAIGTPKELKEKASAKNMEETFINLIKESEVKN